VAFSSVEAICFTFKVVAKVIMLSTTPGQKAGHEIGWEHEWPPALILTDMDMLMIPRLIQAGSIPTQNDVTQTHGRGVD
jgi:hypothetical protein